MSIVDGQVVLLREDAMADAGPASSSSGGQAAAHGHRRPAGQHQPDRQPGVPPRAGRAGGAAALRAGAGDKAACPGLALNCLKCRQACAPLQAAGQANSCPQVRSAMLASAGGLCCNIASVVSPWWSDKQAAAGS